MTEHSALTPDIVRRAGIAIHGEHWQEPLARQLGVAGRTMRRIAKAQRDGTPYPIKPEWAREIRELIRPMLLEREIQGRYAAEVLEALKDL